MSRADLVEAYLSALPLSPVAVIAIPGGGCRVALGGEVAPGETITQQFYFRPTHVEVVLNAAGLTDTPTDQAPRTVAALIGQAAVAMGAGFQTRAQLRKAAAEAVNEIVARTRVASQNGDLKQVNRQYKAYRLSQTARGLKATSYAKFVEGFTATVVREAAARMI
jgi:hypothetical protein